MLQFHDIIRNHKLPNGELGKLRRMSLEIESMVADDSLKKFLVTAIFPHMIEQSKVNDKLPDMTLYEMSIDVSVLYKNPINVLF
jgi:hypothetical protein